MTEEEQRTLVAKIVLEALKERFDMSQRPLHADAFWNGASAAAIQYMHYVTRETGYDWFSLQPEHIH
jgi:hypothetical protein